MSYTFRLTDDFSAIPGLKLWVDGRYNILLDSNDKVQFWNDLSGNEFNFTQSKFERRPLHLDSQWVKSQNEIGSTFMLNTSDLAHLKFLHDGSPNGVYCIVNTALDSQSTTILRTGDNNAQAFQLSLSPGTSSGSIVVTIRDNSGAAVRQMLFNNLKNVSNPNFISFPANLVISTYFTGPNKSNNQSVRVNDKTPIISTDTSLIGEYSTLNTRQNQIVAAQADPNFLKVGLLVVYDWTGFSDADIVKFDTRVRDVLNVVATNFI
jgi:hypothetical protein